MEEMTFEAVFRKEDFQTMQDFLGGNRVLQ